MGTGSDTVGLKPRPTDNRSIFVSIQQITHKHTRKTQPPQTPPRFAVAPPPLSRALFPALEAARLQALKLLGGGRSLYINTPQGTPVHVLVFKFPGQQREAADLLPPIVLLHGVCSTAHDYAPLIRRLRRRCRR